MNIQDFFKKPENQLRTTTASTISDFYPKDPVKTEPEDMYTKASRVTKEKYGVYVPPHFLKAVQQQESSGITDKNNFNLSMGVTPSARKALGLNYVLPISVGDVVQNASNYLAHKAKGTLDSGEKFDLSTPENYSKWYVQRYVGILPGGSRVINGQVVPYEKIVNSFEKLLKQYQQ